MKVRTGSQARMADPSQKLKLLHPHSGPDAWRSYLMQIPLGAPEGSVRALISLFVIIFGMVVLVLQNQLGVKNVEAISGFIGIVITFYFTSRSNDQTQTAVDAVHKAAAGATEAGVEPTFVSPAAIWITCRRIPAWSG